MANKDECEFLDITFDGNKRQYQSGDEVSGLIKFELKGSATVSNLKILLICVSEVKWVESPYTELHRAGHVYHEKMREVLQTYTLPKEYESLSEGVHEVPFKLKLPDKGIPSTFTDAYGTIRFYIEVINEDPGADEGQAVGLYEFDVSSPFRQNLNLSIGSSKEKEFGLLSLASGKVTLYASLAKKGWNPGELLELHITVNNQSTVDVTPRAALHQTQVYMCGEHHKAVEIPITDPIEGKRVEKETNYTETLFIPNPKELSLTIKSALISVKYFVHVTLDIPHAFDIHVNIPVVLTNLPVPTIQ